MERVFRYTHDHSHAPRDWTAELNRCWRIVPYQVTNSECGLPCNLTMRDFPWANFHPYCARRPSPITHFQDQHINLKELAQRKKELGLTSLPCAMRKRRGEFLPGIRSTSKKQKIKKNKIERGKKKTRRPCGSMLPNLAR